MRRVPDTTSPGRVASSSSGVVSPFVYQSSGAWTDAMTRPTVGAAASRYVSISRSSGIARQLAR
jgi:hypothetical protein